jgi:hypothetical protein
VTPIGRKPPRRIKSDEAKLIGKLGGVARAQALTKDQRQQIARKASLTRWGTLWRLD